MPLLYYAASFDFIHKPADFNKPVDEVTWFEARNFCVKRGGRLPTEAEWEYAARGPDSLIYPWGNEFDDAKVVANRSKDVAAANVGSLPAGASWVGTLDMSGNAVEWTNSLYSDYPYKANDGRERNLETNDARIIRGGMWDSYDIHLRTAYRAVTTAADRLWGLGFRCSRFAD